MVVQHKSISLLYHWWSSCLIAIHHRIASNPLVLQGSAGAGLQNTQGKNTTLQVFSQLQSGVKHAQKKALGLAGVQIYDLLVSSYEVKA